MAHFWLIQRGRFATDKPVKTLFIDQNIRYDYMGSAEFEWGALPKSYRRIMYNFNKYVTINTGIYSPEGDELILFCNKEHSNQIRQMVVDFISAPYALKEYSELEKFPTARLGDTSRNGRRTDFWWCIDIKQYGDWMACPASKINTLVETLTKDHTNWWMCLSGVIRDKEYKKSLYW